MRALADKWIRLVHRLWLDRTRYDEALHLENLRRRGSPVIAKIQALEEEKNRQCA